MIRRTLINRARRQRDLAQALIARHSLVAYDRSWPQLRYRPSASSDSPFASAVSAEPLAPALDQVMPFMGELAVPLAAWPEAPAADTPALFNPAQPAELASSTMPVPEPTPIAPDALEPASASPDVTARPAAAAAQRPDNPLADLVRRMREPGWVAPEAAVPASTAPTSAGAEPTTNEPLADLVRRMQRPPQRTTSKADRPRIPLGRRMSEAADFGQTPATPQHIAPVAAPAPPERPATPADSQPARVMPEIAALVDDRLDSDVTHLPDPIVPVEFIGPQPIVPSADLKAATQMIASEGPQMLAQPPGAPDTHQPDKASASAPPAAPRALSQMPEIATTPARAIAIPPSPAPIAESADRPQNQDMPIVLQGLATHDQLMPADVPPGLTNALRRSAADIDLNDQIDAADHHATPPPADLRQPIIHPPAQPSDAYTQSTQAALAAAAQAAAPIAHDRPATAATPPQPSQPQPSMQARADLELNDSRDATTNLPLPSADRTPAPSVAATPADHANVQPFDNTEDQSVTSESAQERLSTLSSKASSPQARHRLLPSQPVAMPGDLASSTIVEPAADSQSTGDARTPNAKRASVHQDTSEDMTGTPDHASPQAWPARMPPHEQSVSLPSADAAGSTRESKVAQQPALKPARRVESQLDLNLPAAESSAAPIAGHDRLVPPHDDTQARAQQAKATEAPMPLPTTAVDKHAPTLQQRQPEPSLIAPTADAPTGGDMPLPDTRELMQKLAETALSRVSDLAKEPSVITLASDPHLIATDRVPAPAAAALLTQAPRPRLPNPDRRSSLIRDTAIITDDIPAADPSAPSSPQAWAARLARHRQATEPQPEPTAARVSAALPIGQAATQAAPVLKLDAAVAPEPSSAQAWAARLARHRQATEPQPEPTAARASAARLAEQRPIEPSEAQALPATANQLASAIVESTPDTSVRFLPARRAGPGAIPATHVDRYTDAIERTPIIHDAPEPGSPQAWAARFARHRQATEPTAVGTPAMPNDRPAPQAAPVVAVDGSVPPEPGSPQAWAARFARHRQVTESQPESIAARLPATHFGQPTLPTTPIGAHASAAAESASSQDWAARLSSPAQSAHPSSAGRQLAVPTEKQHVPTAPLAAAQPLPPQRVPGITPQIALRHAAPTPIAETTRRFLQPLVGIDPAEVRVFRGPAAGNVTAAYQAEALASGDMVALAAEHGEDTPATLGVLAHELTHIARQRDARFVPPLVRRENMSGAANEESLAQSVEMQVRRIARDQDEATWHTLAPIDAPSSSAPPASTPISTPAQPRPAEFKPQPTVRDADWGGLPAPWEPLPGWFDAPKQAQAQSPVVSQPLRSAPPAQQAAASSVASSAPAVQLAEMGRMLDAPPAQSTPVAAPEQQPAADLDALARQVYAVLKQRLAAERRRSQS